MIVKFKNIIRSLLLVFTAFISLTSVGKSRNITQKNSFYSPYVDTTKKKNSTLKKSNKEEKWDIFWKEFNSAITTKDKTKIAELTSKEFYDGGGSTIQEWLESEVFASETKLNAFKNILKKGTKNYKGFDNNPYKATGRNKSGDLFFEYKNNKWLFGGVVGD